MFSRDTVVLCSTYLAFSFWRNKLSICKLFLLLWFLIDLICSIKERDCIRVIGSHASGCQASPWCCTGQWNICFTHTLGSQERKVWLQIYISCIVPHILFETLSLDVQNNFDNFKFACFDAYFSGEGEEPMTALDAERLAQGKRTKLT